MKPAPIVLFCYNRVSHLQQTVEALLGNSWASQSDLIIFSDGPKNEQAAQEVEKVRSYIRSIQGFANIQIHLSENNKGLAPSVIAGVSKVLEQYGKAIIMEDDVICSPVFLDFMNNALELYQDQPHILSVSGYNFSLDKMPNFNEDVALTYRASSYGWGTWKNRWKQVDWNAKAYPTFKANPSEINRLQLAGDDIPAMLEKQQRGLISSWAVRWTFHHVLSNGFCLVPIHTYIKTIGNDGSGSNGVARTLKTQVHLNPTLIPLPRNPQPSNWVNEFIKKYNRPSFVRQVINRIKFGI